MFVSDELMGKLLKAPILPQKMSKKMRLMKDQLEL